ncbi:MAG: DNA-binding protein [Actinomycetota bacterium]|nr:DNA-binding protein [Actinomycetota bacterium]
MTTSRSFVIRHSSFVIGLLCCLMFLNPGLAAAEVVSSGELVERCQFYDGKVVTFRGEVVGDVMIRGEFAWINVNDDAYSKGSRKLAGYNSGQSIWCRADDAKLIEVTGDYRHVGDIVEVRGMFNRACPEHGGDMDIHANEVRVVRRGRSISHPIENGKIRAASILFVISFALFALGRILRWRRLRGRAPEPEA